MKRILIFAAYFQPHVGGYERVVFELSRRLVQRGYQIDVLTCNTEKAKPYEELNGIGIHRLPCWNALNGVYPIPKPCPTTFKILRRLLRKHYDVVNTQTRFFVTSFLGLIFAKLKKAPLVHTEHGTKHSVVPNKVVDLISRAYDHTIGTLILKSASRNIGISEAVCQFLKHLGAANIQLVHNGIDTTVFRRQEDTNYRQKLCLGDDAIVITFVGRLIYAKAVQDLIAVFPRIKEAAPNARLLIVGDGPYRATLENLAHQAACGRDILFLGQKNQAELVYILSATDIFVNPSYSEGLPTSVMEAASVGVAVIATDVGGTGEIVRNYETGMVVKAGDIGQLEQKLRELVTNAELRKRLGANARMFVEQEFGWDKILRDWIEIVEGPG